MKNLSRSLALCLSLLLAACATTGGSGRTAEARCRRAGSYYVSHRCG